MSDDRHLETATLGGGCFWCTEAVFEELRGVESVDSGYSGGLIPNPTYEQVCSGATGHAEVVRVTFEEVIADLDGRGIWEAPIVTTIEPEAEFYPAEAYHREYYRRNPRQGYCQVVIAPKVAKFRKTFTEFAKA